MGLIDWIGVVSGQRLDCSCDCHRRCTSKCPRARLLLLATGETHCARACARDDDSDEKLASLHGCYWQPGQYRSSSQSRRQMEPAEVTFLLYIRRHRPQTSQSAPNVLAQVSPWPHCSVAPRHVFSDDSQMLSYTQTLPDWPP